MTASIRWIDVPLDAPSGDNTTFDLTQGAMYPPTNWLPHGGRVIPRTRWRPNEQVSLPSPFTARGLDMNFREGGVKREINVAHFDGTNYDFWAHDVANDGSPEVSSSAWTSRDANVVVGASYNAVPVAFAVGTEISGGGILYYGNPGFSSGRGRYVQGGGVASQIATDFTAGYAAAYHLSRFWIGGATDFPNRLKWSQIGDVASWNVSENFIPVGAAQVAIFGLLVWDRGLLVGKGDGLWWLAGSTIDSFQLIPISSRVGVGPGPTNMVSTPHGVFFMGVDSNLYLYDGGEVEKVNKRYEFLSRTTNMSAGGSIPSTSWSCAWMVDRLYVTRSGSGYIEVYVPGLDSFYVESLSTTSVHQVASYNDSYLVMMPATNTSYAIASFRSEDATHGSADRLLLPDDGLALTYDVSWGEFIPNPRGKATLKEAIIRYRQYGSDPNAETGLLVSAVNETGAGGMTRTVGRKAVGGLYTEHLQYAVTGERISVSLAAGPAATDDEAYEIHQLSLGFLVDEDRR